MSDPRVIKKYPNRRLYDTEISKYITLGDVRKLVLDGEAFCVRDAKTEEDLTRSILLQIIMEQEIDGQPIFSEEMLTQVIRFYGDSLQGMITNCLENTMRAFAEQQGRLREQMGSLMQGDALGLMREMTERNFGLWRDMQEGFLRATMPGAASRKAGTGESAAKDKKSGSAE
ncbi:MAG: polyhydroxyalkanoate synthesis repressor PhaR [Gammaproteobacteria bacterium]